MKKIAVIGTGVAAMGAAYFLKDEYDIAFFEKEDYAGGHTNTLTIDEDGTPIYIDSAFMVYNRVTYPNLIKLFAELEVPEKKTNMSFSVQHVPSGLDYCGTGYNGLFSQRKNIFNPQFIKMLLDINRFNKQSLEVLTDEDLKELPLSEYIKLRGYSEDFLYKYLVPMSSAVWSTPVDLMLKFPAATLVQFFKNHGFLGMTTQHQWWTVDGGSRQYRDKIMKHFSDKIMLKNAAHKVYRKEGKATVLDESGNQYEFDKVIFGCHSDQALNVLGDPTDMERQLLSKFKYQPNTGTLHTDDSIMPKTRRAWSSWNYRVIKDGAGDWKTTTIYWMNSLQQVSQKKDYFISINEAGEIDRSKVLWEKSYDHPLFDVEAQQAQKDLPKLNENDTAYFCGAYFRYGFHEDGFASGLEVVKAITGEYPKGYRGFN